MQFNFWLCFTMRSNDNINFPPGWIKYYVMLCYIQTSHRLALCKIFKTLNIREPYLLINYNRFIKSALTKFWCGVLGIAVHRNRYKTVNTVNTNSLLCISANEDKVHFVLWCPTFDDLRKQFIPLKHYSLLKLFRLSILLATQNEISWKTLECNYPQWGAADAEIKVPSGEDTELKRFPLKAWSRSVYSHTCYAYCQGLLPCLFLPFRSIHLHFFFFFASCHKSHFFTLSIFCGHSTREPASGRMAYFIMRAYTGTMC